MHKANWRIFYPLLLGMYAPLGLLAFNIDQLKFSTGVRSIILSAIVVLGVYALFCWRVMEPGRAALLCSWCLLFFFAYGHVYSALAGVTLFDFPLARNSLLFPLWLGVFTLVGWWILKKAVISPEFSQVMNWASVLLLLMPVIMLAAYETQRYRLVHAGETPASNQAAGAGTVEGNQMLPDIYHIILDGYPRADVLRDYHQFDNRGFIDSLEELGFYVPACSQSNYAMTDLSLASTLNMDYLEALEPNIRSIDLPGTIIHSRARQFLEGLGYRVISFESGIWFTEFRDGDMVVSSDPPLLASLVNFQRFSEFEVLFLRTTVLRLAEAIKFPWLDLRFQSPERLAYDRVLFEFDQLEKLPSLPGPKYVFAHILAPHTAPYLVKEDGSFQVSDWADPALGNELVYLNQRTLAVVRAILAQSEPQPVIIIHGDHGIDVPVRNAIFSAYFMPQGNDLLSPTTSPVNAYRILLDAYFDQQLPILADESLYSPYEHKYQLQLMELPCSE